MRVIPESREETRRETEATSDRLRDAAADLKAIAETSRALLVESRALLALATKHACALAYQRQPSSSAT